MKLDKQFMNYLKAVILAAVLSMLLIVIIVQFIQNSSFEEMVISVLGVILALQSIATFYIFLKELYFEDG